MHPWPKVFTAGFVPWRHASVTLVVACIACSALTFGCQSGQSAPAGGTAPNSTADAGPRRLEVGSGTAPRSPTTNTATKPAANPTAARNDPTSGLMAEGSEVDGNVGASRLPAGVRAAAQKPTTTPGPPIGSGASGGASGGATGTGGAGGTSGTGSGAAGATAAGKAGWSILLASFSDEGHRGAAEAARNTFMQRFPELRGAQVRSLASGSAVVIGRFDGPRDPAAQAELLRVKRLGTGEPKPFARAMLVRVSTTPTNAPPGPNDLRIVRRDRPKVTLYTLQVAAWASLGSKELSMEQIKRAAENYTQQLRAQGYEAYYYHDYDVETSIVTVGVFGADSYDSRSTLYAPDVEAAMRKFPKSLVNGEEVLVPVDPKNPRGKSVPQSARLVEIPKL